MEPYFIIFSLLAFFALLDAFDPPRSQKLIILFFCFVLLTLFAGLRCADNDYIAYLRGFRDIERWGLDYSRLTAAKAFEPGYNLLARTTLLLTHSPVAFFLLVATIGVGLNLSSYSRYSDYFLVAVLLYFVHTFLLREAMQIRAGVAAGICLYSLRHVDSRSLAKFLISVAIAASFHLASLVFAMVYWIYRMDWGRRVWIWITVASLAVAFVMPLGGLLSHLPGGGVQQRILVYSYMIDGPGAGILTNPTIVKQLFFVFVGLRYWDTLSEKAPYFKLLFVPLVISLCWLLVWNDFSIFAARIATFFSVTEVLVVPCFLYLFTPRSRPLATLAIVVFAFAVLYLNVRPGSNVPEYFSIISPGNNLILL